MAHRTYTIEFGKRYGRLKAIKWSDRKAGDHQLVECQCSCPAKTIVYRRSYDLRSGRTKSCGCLHKERDIGPALDGLRTRIEDTAIRQDARGRRCHSPASAQRFLGVGDNTIRKWKRSCPYKDGAAKLETVVFKAGLSGDPVDYFVEDDLARVRDRMQEFPIPDNLTPTIEVAERLGISLGMLYYRLGRLKKKPERKPGRRAHRRRTKRYEGSNRSTWISAIKRSYLTDEIIEALTPDPDKIHQTEVERLLKASASTVQKLRDRGLLSFERKPGAPGTYSRKEVLQMAKDRRANPPKQGVLWHPPPREPNEDIADAQTATAILRPASSDAPNAASAFGPLREYALANLKGKQRKMVLNLIERDGQILLTDLVTIIGWAQPVDDNFNSCRKAVNKKLRRCASPCFVYRHENHAKIKFLGQK